MEYTDKLQAGKFLQSHATFFFISSLVLLVTVLVQSIVIYRTVINMPVRMIPVGINQPFDAKSDVLDATEIDQFSRLFMSMRFNLQPQNVKQNLGLLESYVSSDFYEQIKPVLDEEISYIIKHHISTTFHILSIKTYQKHNTALISGVLARTEGEVPVDSHKKKFLIQYRYEFGKLQIINFKDVSNEKEIKL